MPEPYYIILSWTAMAVYGILTVDIIRRDLAKRKQGRNGGNKP